MIEERRMNPMCFEVCRKLEIDKYADMVSLVYEKDKECKAYLYDMSKTSIGGRFVPEEEEIHPKELVDLLRDLLYPMKSSESIFTLGTDLLHIYDYSSHREVLYLRLTLPTGILQIDYADDTQNIDVLDAVAEALRSNFSLVEN